MYGLKMLKMVGSQRVFDSIRSLYELGNEHYHSPAIGAEVPTGLSTISFSYPSKLKLHGTPNAEYDLSKIVCRLHEENGYPITASGSYVTIGFVTTKGSMDA